MNSRDRCVLARVNDSNLTTQAMILGSGDALFSLRYRIVAVTPLDALENDPGVEIVMLSGDLYSRGLERTKSGG